MGPSNVWGWSTEAEQFCLGLSSLSVSLSLQGLKASTVISPYGLVWVSSQNGGLTEVNLFIRPKKFSRMVYSTLRANKVGAALPFFT